MARAYWDGGYSGNPTIDPAGHANCVSDDTILVQINPVERPGTPRIRLAKFSIG